MGTPAWDLWLASVWGPSYEGLAGPTGFISNIVVGNNPAYTVEDFLAFYPKFAGTPLNLTGTTESGSPNITLSAAPSSSIPAGSPISGAGIPDGATVVSVSGTAMVISEDTTASGSGVALTVDSAPLIPLVVLNAYIALASASLAQARWQDTWEVAMGLFVAHFASLYARSDGTPNSTIGQIAAQGISTGIQVSKSVGDISVNYQVVQGLEDWSAWNLTTYGQQLATFAKIIGMGPMLFL